MLPFVCDGWVGACVCLSVTPHLVGTIQTTSFASSLSNFTCMLFIMRRGSLLILGHEVKGQGQLWHSVHETCWQDTDYRFCPSTVKLHMPVVDNERGNPIDFGLNGQGQLWHCVLNLVGTIQTSVLFQSLSNFTCQLLMMRGGSYWFWVAGSKVKVDFGTLCIILVGKMRTIHFKFNHFIKKLCNFYD